MVEEKNPTLTATDHEGVPTVQTLNVVPQKVIQVDKPTEYYKNREKTKIFIYQVYFYRIINAVSFPDNQTKVMFAVFYC